MTCQPKAWWFCRLSGLLCGFSISRQSTFLLAVSRAWPHFGKTLQTYHIKPQGSVAQLVKHLPLKLEDVGSRPSWDRIFSHGCVHLGMCRWCGSYPISVSAERATLTPHSLMPTIGHVASDVQCNNKKAL